MLHDGRMSTSLPTHVWINGRCLTLEAARISPFDQGLTLGDGAFETLVDRGHGPLALAAHHQRLTNACERLDLPAPSEALMRSAFQELMQANGMTTARLRFTITRGESLFKDKPTMIASAIALHEWPATERVRLVPWKRNPHSALTGIKSLSYGENVIALAHARTHGAGEAILANTRDELCEGTGSNIFIVTGQRVITPPLTSGCLPGVTRELVIAACKASRIELEERPVPIREFLEATEAFLTSSTRDVHPISHIDDRQLPPAPGHITRSVQFAYADILR